MNKIPYIMKASVEEMIDLKEFLEDVEEDIADGVDLFAALRPMFEQYVGREAVGTNPEDWLEFDDPIDMRCWKDGFIFAYNLFKGGDQTDEKLEEIATQYYERTWEKTNAQ